jgi:peptidoglycan/LPS O-acetylase OafA/YrhL
MGWTWSLAIEEQFYLVCPLLVSALGSFRIRGRLALISGIALVLAGVAAWVVVTGHFHAVDSEIVINRDIPRWAAAYDHLYVKPWMRAGTLLAGVAAAYLFRTPAAMDALARRRAVSGAGLVVALGVAAACTHWPLVWGAPRGVEVAFLALYRTFFGISIAYILLLSLSRHPAGQLLGRVLSSRLLYPFGQLAYAAYLLNPIVSILVHQSLSPLVWAGVAPPMALFLPFDLVGTFLAATLLHLFIERPVMNLRPRST